MFDTPEEKAALKEQIDASVAAAIASTQASVDKLTANNAALKTELRAAQKGAEIDPAKYAALEDKVADLTATLSTTEGSLKKAQTDAEKTVKQLTAQLESESGFTQKLLVENGINDAMVKANVAPPFHAAVRAMLKDQVKVVIEGDARKAMVGEKPLSEFFPTWAQSDEGKTFVSAPSNSGAGGSGSNDKGAATKVIAAGDSDAFNANLSELAKGVNSAVKIA